MFDISVIYVSSEINIQTLCCLIPAIYLALLIAPPEAFMNVSALELLRYFKVSIAPGLIILSIIAY